MATILGFGKYKGLSLEEIALGRKCPDKSKGSEGYYYFYQLAKGDPKYFSIFQQDLAYMARWNEIHYKLNNFIPVYKCKCGKDATVMSIAGSREFGYSMGPSYVACDDRSCQNELAVMTSTGTRFYRIGFDSILYFGWNNGGTKHDERQVTEFLRRLAGWPYGQMINARNSTAFINGLKTR